jgi:NitT/TauT family transport system permease protein
MAQVATLEAPRPTGIRRPRGLRKILAPLGFFVVVAIIWQIGAEKANSILLPTFTETVEAFFGLLGSGQLWGPLLRSNVTMLLGFAISAAIGVPLGLLLGRRELLDHIFAPYVALLVVVPVAPLLPVIVMVFGISTITPALVLVVLFSVVYIVVNTRAGMRSVDARLVEMATSYGAGELAIWRYVLIPGALPAIGTGLRIGLGRAFAGMILGELLLIPSGIGYQMLLYQGLFADAKLFAIVVVLLIEAVFLGTFMRRVERRLQRAG